MKRIYQLGKATELYNNKDLNAILRAREGIELLYGKEDLKKIVKEVTNSIRKKYNIPYVIGIAPSYENNEVILVYVFEQIYKDKNTYRISSYDEEKDLMYIEVDE